MRSCQLLVVSLFALSTAGCDDHDHPATGYATLQACFDVHTQQESLTVDEAIVVCCLDHAIGGHTEVCGATIAACVTYVGAELTDASATAAEIDTSCMSYITQGGL